jgi:predicted GNAT family acetyltransferase
LALEHGTGAVVARDLTDSRIVGGGTFPSIVNGVTEVAAIGVAVTHRRRGIAQALARRLAEEAVGRGARTPFLMAAHEAEARIYERAGYREIGTILHISR